MAAKKQPKRKSMVPDEPLARMHICVAVEGRNIMGEHIARVSGTCLEMDTDGAAEFFTMDEVIVTTDLGDIFATLEKTFKKLAKN